MKIMHPLSCLMLAVFTNGTALAEKPTQGQQRLAIAAVKLQLKDPASAVFSNFDTFIVGDSRRICGEVRAKNSYGGYNNPLKFWMISQNGRVNLVTFDTPDRAGLVDRLCNHENAIKSELEDKTLQRQIAEDEKTAICSSKSTASTKGECGAMFERCSKEFSTLPVLEARDYVTLCLQKGMPVAQEKFKSTLGATITFN